MTRSRVLLGLLLGTLCLAAACVVSVGRYRTGYATYYVEFYDTIVDSTGKRQRALCADYVTFVGDLDTACASYPMVWSYGQYAWVTCHYVDSLGRPLRYVDYFYFPAGYIQEPSCPSYPNDYRQPDADPLQDPYESTELPRNANGEVELPADVALDDGAPTPLPELRGLVADRITTRAAGEDAPTTVRDGDATLGDPPADAPGHERPGD